MPYIKVNANKLSSFQETLNGIQTKVRRINSDFSSIGSSLDWDVKSSSNINQRINNIKKDLNSEVRSVQNMSSFLAKARSKYVALDETKIKVKSPVVSAVSTVAANAKVSTTKKSNSSWKTIGKVVGKMGFVGTALSGLINWTTNGGIGNATAVVDLAKSGKNVVKGLVDWNKAAKNRKIYANFGKATQAKSKYWKSAFGLNDLFKGTASKFRAKWVKSPAGSGLRGSLQALGQNLKTGIGKGWGTRFSRNFTKNIKSQVGSYAKGAKSAFSWIGLGLNFVGNAVSNYDEAKNGGISAQRAVAETITETVVDTATGWVIGAGVAAGLAATIGSAPVLVVGAATVGITMGLDFACKKITGAITGTEKGLTETISDFALDVGEAVSKGAKKIVSGVGNAIKDTGKKVGKFFGKLFGK